MTPAKRKETVTPEAAARFLARVGLEEPRAWREVLADPQVAYRLAIKDEEDAEVLAEIREARRVIESSRSGGLS